MGVNFQQNYLKVIFELVPITTYKIKLKFYMQITLERIQ